MYFVSPTYLGRPAYILFTPKLMHVAVFFIYFFFLLVWFVWKKKKKKKTVFEREGHYSCLVS